MPQLYQVMKANHRTAESSREKETPKPIKCYKDGSVNLSMSKASLFLYTLFVDMPLNVLTALVTHFLLNLPISLVHISQWEYMVETHTLHRV